MGEPLDPHSEQARQPATPDQLSRIKDFADWLAPSAEETARRQAAGLHTPSLDTYRYVDESGTQRILLARSYKYVPTPNRAPELAFLNDNNLDGTSTLYYLDSTGDAENDLRLRVEYFSLGSDSESVTPSAPEGELDIDLANFRQAEVLLDRLGIVALHGVKLKVTDEPE